MEENHKQLLTKKLEKKVEIVDLVLEQQHPIITVGVADQQVEQELLDKEILDQTQEEANQALVVADIQNLALVAVDPIEIEAETAQQF